VIVVGSCCRVCARARARSAETESFYSIESKV